MNRLTTDKPVSEMGMFELAHNACYAVDGVARYKDFGQDIDARELARKLMVHYGLWEDSDTEMVDDDYFDESMLYLLSEGPTELAGLIALFYRNLWAAAELREKLKAYEDAEEQEMLVRMPCKVGDMIYEVDPASDELISCRVRYFILVGSGFGVSVVVEEGRGVGSTYEFYKGDFGKIVFTSREEAEAKLKEGAE